MSLPTGSASRYLCLWFPATRGATRQALIRRHHGQQAESRIFEGWTGPFKVGDHVMLTLAGIDVRSGVIALLNDDGLWLADPEHVNLGNWFPKGSISEISTKGWKVRTPESR